MALTPGTRLGVYEVTAQIGAGGMGEVYRARDTKLGREVALKVLPELFVSDPERVARFQREAKTLAALNHPNIAAIYGFEEADGLQALVLELIEGPTLADRIAQWPIPLDEALPIATQIADALEAAHGRGIIHRDLKPANIKITATGTVKVLDFGLAKAVSGDGLAPDLSHSPTVTTIGTREGIILGTAAYMSPEQARGRSVDKRSDIWAFGCVLYEMLTGRSPFAGDTFTDIVARILEREPDWRALPASVPPNILRLLQRCLEKDPQRRVHDVADARIEIDDARSGARSSAAFGPVLGRRAILIVGAGLAAAALTSGAYIVWQRPEPDPPAASPRRFTFSQLTFHPGGEWFPSLSPDGKWLVYSGQASGNRDIYLQSVGGQNPINLTADFPEDDDQPAFSPEGERIAFRSSRQGGGIFVMGRTGEAPRRLTSAGFRPAWSPDGTTIAYSTENVDVNPQNDYGSSGLWVVDVNSGKARDLNLNNGAQASFSPDGRRLAVTARHSDARQMDIVTVPLDVGEETTVVTGPATDWNPVWSPDGRYLYYSSDRGGSMNLWRVPINMSSGQARGEPEPVTTPSAFAAHPSISSDGKLMAFSSVTNTTNVARLSIDPTTATVKGEPSDVTSGSRSWSSPDPSPDGQWVTFYSRLNPEGDVYVARTDGTSQRQLTSDAADRVPRWSPDANWIAFFSNRSGPYAIWKIHADGSGLQQLTEDGSSYPTWSPDGSRMAVGVLTPQPKAYVFETNRPWKSQSPEILPSPPSTDGMFIPNSWSRNGQWLAGQIGRTTQGIATYSFRSRSFDVLTDFGEYPVWLPDSRRILFVAGGTDFLVIDAETKQYRKVYTGTREVLGPPRLTGDGRTAYFTRRITASDIWLLKIE